jgi:hypothetical protein
MKEFKLRLGAACSSIYTQLAEQGFDFDNRLVSHFDELSKSIIQLRIHGYIPDSQIKRMQQKLVKEIEKHLLLTNTQK